MRERGPAHTHDDETRLTVGCDGCIWRVRQDQRAAELAEAPERTLVIEWEARVRKTGTVYYETNVLPSESADDAAERCQDAIADLVMDALTEALEGDPDLEWSAEFETVRAQA